MKVTGLCLLFLSLFSLFLCVERCSANSNAADRINAQTQAVFGPQGQVKATMPVLSKYALFWSFVFGIAGAVVLAKAPKPVDPNAPYDEMRAKRHSSKENEDPPSD